MILSKKVASRDLPKKVPGQYYAMKRLADDEQQDLACLQQKRIKRPELFLQVQKERDFFCDMWPYEQSRWLYAMKGLLPSLDADTTRLILVTLMYLQAGFSRCTYANTTVLDARRYVKTDGPKLHRDIREHLCRFFREKVAHEAGVLLSRGVPEEHLCVICCNVPYDGMGSIFHYDELKDDVMKYHCWVSYIVVPHNLEYTCLDMNDTEGIRERLSVGQLSYASLEEFRGDVNDYEWYDEGSQCALV